MKQSFFQSPTKHWLTDWGNMAYTTSSDLKRLLDYFYQQTALKLAENKQLQRIKRSWEIFWWEMNQTNTGLFITPISHLGWSSPAPWMYTFLVASEEAKPLIWQHYSHALPIEIYTAATLHLKEYRIKPGRISEGGRDEYEMQSGWQRRRKSKTCSCPDGASVGILYRVCVCVCLYGE